MTIVVEAEEHQLDEIDAVAGEVEAVTAIQDLSAGELTARELLLLKVRATPENIPKIMQTAEMFRAEVIAVNDSTLTLAHVSIAQRIDGMIRALRPLGIVELARSGRIAVTNREAPNQGAGE
jgi:acetolactate synthase-1/3 small subunit